MLQPELKFRRDKIRYLMAQQGIDAALIACNVNLLYTYGEIVNGYLFLPLHSPALLFVKRPNNIVGEFVFPIRKPEQMVDLLKENGIPVASKIMLEGGELPYADYMRLASLFPGSEVVDGTAIIREARSVKTPLEIELFRRSAALHARAYSKIPDVYHPGMTDRELSVEVERLMRLEGCLGIFRAFGQSMEIFMGSVLNNQIILLMLQPELKFRRDKIRYLMAQQGIDAALIACNVNLLYTYGEIVNGYLFLPLHSPALLFVKRPNNIVGEFVFPIRKPEQMVDLLKENGIPVASKIMLEGGELPYADYMRLASLFPGSEVVDGTAIIREARSVKTPLEIELFRRSAALHARAYSKIPDVYHPGMTDRELSVEVERLMRLEGCLGIFRAFGQSMEIFMGSVLAGDNAATPSPYDFALGGKGLDPSLPGGMNGTLLKEGYSVMVDIGGNFYGYMCDMSRVFSIGKLNDEAYAAHQVCLEVQDKVASMTAPGVVCEDLYNAAIEIVTKAGFADRFMGVSQQARFIGHGIGLEINEAPVLAPRIRRELEEGMVFALEPKIVLPGVGPVGIENSWVVTENGVGKLTICNEEIIEL